MQYSSTCWMDGGWGSSISSVYKWFYWKAEGNYLMHLLIKLKYKYALWFFDLNDHLRWHALQPTSNYNSKTSFINVAVGFGSVCQNGGRFMDSYLPCLLTPCKSWILSAGSPTYCRGLHGLCCNYLQICVRLSPWRNFLVCLTLHCKRFNFPTL